MNLKELTQPPQLSEPVTGTEAMGYLQLDDAEDQLPVIEGLATAARLLAEANNGRILARRTFELALDAFPSGEIVLPTPTVSIEGFTWKALDGTTTTLVADTDFVLDDIKEPSTLIVAPGKAWPTAVLWPTSPIRIRLTAGKLKADVPQSIKQGIQLLISQWYESRIPFDAIRYVAEIPFSVRYLFESDRLFWL